MWRLWSILVLALLGVGVAGYLTYERFSGVGLICWGGSSDCETVQNSPYAQVGPVPIALIGLVGYVGFVVLVTAQMRTGSEMRRTLAGLNFGLALSAFLYAAYLSYLQRFVIRASCTWCFSSAILIALIFVLTIWELWALTKGTET